MLYELTSPPLFPPAPGLPWGHALYMRKRRLTLVDRRPLPQAHAGARLVAGLRRVKRSMDEILDRIATEAGHPPGFRLTPAERAEFLETVRQEAVDKKWAALYRPGAELDEA